MDTLWGNDFEKCVPGVWIFSKEQVSPSSRSNSSLRTLLLDQVNHGAKIMLTKTQLNSKLGTPEMLKWRDTEGMLSLHTPTIGDKKHSQHLLGQQLLLGHGAPASPAPSHPSKKRKVEEEEDEEDRSSDNSEEEEKEELGMVLHSPYGSNTTMATSCGVLLLLW